MSGGPNYALVSDSPRQAGGLSPVAGRVRYAIAVPSGITTWRLTVRDRRMVMATARAPARPASAKAAPAPALWARTPAAAVPAEAPLTTAVESQANASVTVPSGAAWSAIALMVA